MLSKNQKLGQKFVTVPTTFDLYRRVRIAAAQRDCSVAEFGRRALEAALKEIEKSEAEVISFEPVEGRQ